MTDVNVEAGSCAGRIWNDRSSGRKERLLEIILSPRHSAYFEARFESGGDGGVLLKLDAEKLADHFRGQVIGSWPESTGADDQVAKLARLPKGPKQLFFIVANPKNCRDLDAEGEQTTGDISRVSVDNFAGGELVTGAEDDRFFDHAETLVSGK